MSTFNYTITEFNQDTKTLKVDYDDGSWAQIQLREPLPTTKQELDDIVKQYTATKEVMEARNGNANLNFITDLIGQERTAERHSMATQLTVNIDNSNPNEVIL
jgi:hypothetical protein